MSKVKLLLDSGAYSAWSKSVPLDVHKYIEYIQHFDKHIWRYVNLDCIPRSSSRIEVEESAKASYQNLVTMRKAGLDPMPVYHRGERPYWLERLIGEGSDYIGLGGMVGAPYSERYKFLDRVFSQTCGDAPYTKVKFHGFGVTVARTIVGYPWYSVDSTSWAVDSGFGFLLVPRPGKDCEFDLSKPPEKISVSAGSKTKPTPIAVLKTGRQIKQVGKDTLHRINRWCAEIGIPLDQLTPATSEAGVLRRLAHCKYYVRLGEYVRTTRPTFRSAHGQGLFARRGLSGSDTPHKRFAFFAAANRRPEVQFILGAGLPTILSSYYFLQPIDRRNPRMIHAWAETKE